MWGRGRYLRALRLRVRWHAFGILLLVSFLLALIAPWVLFWFSVGVTAYAAWGVVLSVLRPALLFYAVRRAFKLWGYAVIMMAPALFVIALRAA